MNAENWKDILDNIKQNFKEIEQGSIQEEHEGGALTEFIIFDGPLGRMKLEFSVKPKVLDKKTIYSNRIGSDVKTEYVYSETETVSKLKAYRFDDDRDGWVEMEAGNFNQF